MKTLFYLCLLGKNKRVCHVENDKFTCLQNNKRNAIYAENGISYQRKNFNVDRYITVLWASKFWTTLKRCFTYTLIVVLGYFCVNQAHAAIDLYIGAGLGISQLEPETGEVTSSLKSKHGFTNSFFIGKNIIDKTSLEVAYNDLGEVTLNPKGMLGYRIINVSALYRFWESNSSRKGNGWSFFGRIGAGKLSIDSNAYVKINHEYLWLFGGGMQYWISDHFGLRTEFTNYGKDARSVAFSMLYQFPTKK